MRFCFAAPRTLSNRRKAQQSRCSSNIAWSPKDEEHCQRLACSDESAQEVDKCTKCSTTKPSSYRSITRRPRIHKVAPDPSSDTVRPNEQSQQCGQCPEDASHDAFCKEMHAKAWRDAEANHRARQRVEAATAAFRVLCGDNPPQALVSPQGPKKNLQKPLPPLPRDGHPIPPGLPHPWQDAKSGNPRKSRSKSSRSGHLSREHSASAKHPSAEGHVNREHSASAKPPVLRGEYAPEGCNRRDHSGNDRHPVQGSEAGPEASMPQNHSASAKHPVQRNEPDPGVASSCCPSASSSRLRSGAPPGDSPHVLSTASIATLSEELALAKNMPLAKRKKLFLSLCRHWHPDKNGGNELRAKAMFQQLQNEKGWFLAER